MKRTVINIAAAATTVVVVREVKHLIYDCAGSVESYVLLKRLHLVEYQTRWEQHKLRRLSTNEILAVINGKPVAGSKARKPDPSKLGGIKPFEYSGPNSL